ncbi:MAG: THUMP domain-containing class I SAM-dependent RNA methyltransferase [Gemmatimonadales bacterium]
MTTTPPPPPRVAALAVTHLGMEQVLAGELAALGLPGAVMPGGVAFEGSLLDVAKANLMLRTAGRVLVRIASFRARTFPELERHAAKVPWAQFLTVAPAVHFRVTAKKSRLSHERAIAERLVRALKGAVPKATIVAGRDEADADDGVQRFVVRFHRDECTVSADSSGAPLHRRGYRLETGKAPLRETLAAGLLLSSGWDGTTPLIDPFCGSGVIPIEAALITRRIPPGASRQFALERWPGFDAKAFRSLRDAALAASLPASPVPISGADRDAGAIRAASANAERAGVAGDVTWHQQPISALTAASVPGAVVTNPPYGARIGERGSLRDLYAQLGNVLRRHAAGWTVTLISADRKLDGQTGLSWHELLRTENGGLPVRFVRAEVPGE